MCPHSSVSFLALFLFLLLAVQSECINQLCQVWLGLRLKVLDNLSLLHEQFEVVSFIIREPLSIVLGDMNRLDASVLVREHIGDPTAGPVELLLLGFIHEIIVVEVAPILELDVEVGETLTVLHPAQDTKPHLFLAEFHDTAIFLEFMLEPGAEHQAHRPNSREVASANTLDPPFADFGFIEEKVVLTVKYCRTALIELFVDAQKRKIDVIIVDNALHEREAIVCRAVF